MSPWSLYMAWMEVVLARRDKGAQRGGPCSGHGILDRGGGGAQLEGRECLSTVARILPCQAVWPSQGPSRLSSMQEVLDLGLVSR